MMLAHNIREPATSDKTTANAAVTYFTQVAPGAACAGGANSRTVCTASTLPGDIHCTVHLKTAILLRIASVLTLFFCCRPIVTADS